MIFVHDIIRAIGEESSTNGKIKILKENSNIKLLKDILYLTYSPRIKFYIKKVPVVKTDIAYNIGLENVLRSLDKIYNREVTGNAAINYLSSLLELLSNESIDIVTKVVKKDLKIGMNVKNINKAIPGLIEITPYMGAKPFSHDLVNKLFKNSEMVLLQEKMDGMFCNVVVEDRKITVLSRKGNVINLEEIDLIKSLSKWLCQGVLIGELLIEGFERKTSNGLLISISNIEEKKLKGLLVAKQVSKIESEFNIRYEGLLSKIKMVCWDYISIRNFNQQKSIKPYADRLNYLSLILSSQNDVSTVPTKTVKTKKEAMAEFSKIIARGGEGAILKDAYGKWKHGKPNHCVKMKMEIHLDLKIVGFQYGKEGTKNENVVSTLILESSDGLLKTNPSGMKESEMKWVTKNKENLLNTIVEIRCCGLSQDKLGNYSTLHPSIEEFRSDKTTANSLEECKEIEKSFIELI